MIIEKRLSESYEVLLYIGCKEGYNGRLFSKEELISAIGSFQDNFPKSLPVRISSCAYIFGSYKEFGHEISAILYPNHQLSLLEIDNFMTELAKYLLEKFKQNRITMRKLSPSWPCSTIMFESDEAEIPISSES